MEIINELDLLGILSNPIDGTTINRYNWLSDAEKTFLLEICLTGERGMHKREVAKKTKIDADLCVRMEGVGLLSWERDNNGRLMFLTVTWQGKELGEALLKKARAASHRATARSC